MTVSGEGQHMIPDGKDAIWACWRGRNTWYCLQYCSRRTRRQDVGNTQKAGGVALEHWVSRAGLMSSIFFIVLGRKKLARGYKHLAGSQARTKTLSSVCEPKKLKNTVARRRGPMQQLRSFGLLATITRITGSPSRSRPPHFSEGAVSGTSVHAPVPMVSQKWLPSIYFGCYG